MASLEHASLHSASVLEAVAAGLPVSSFAGTATSVADGVHVCRTEKGNELVRLRERFVDHVSGALVTEHRLSLLPRFAAPNLLVTGGAAAKRTDVSNSSHAGVLEAPTSRASATEVPEAHLRAALRDLLRAGTDGNSGTLIPSPRVPASLLNDFLDLSSLELLARSAATLEGVSDIALEANMLSADPAQQGHPVRNVLGTRPGGALRFRGGSVLGVLSCKLPLSATDRLRTESSSSGDEAGIDQTATALAFVHLTWERELAPAAVYLQVSRDGQEWITADGVDLSSSSSLELYGSEQQQAVSGQNGASAGGSSGVESASLPQADAHSGAVGTLLHAYKFVPSPSNGTPNEQIRWTCVHACKDARFVRVVCRGWHPENSRRIVGISHVRMMRATQAAVNDAFTVATSTADISPLIDATVAATAHSALQSALTSTPAGDVIAAARGQHVQSSSAAALTTVSDLPLCQAVRLLAGQLYSIASTGIKAGSRASNAGGSDNNSGTDPEWMDAVKGLVLLALATGLRGVAVLMAQLVLESQQPAALVPAHRKQLLRHVSGLTAAIRELNGYMRRREAGLAWSSAVQAANSCGLPIFDADGHTRGIVISNGGSTCASRHTGGDSQYSYAMATTGFPLRGRHSWTFRIDQDVNGDENVSLGFAVRPVRESRYDASSDMWTVRAYNGRLYCRAGSRVMNTVPNGPIRRDSTVTFTLDGGARHVSIAINGAHQGIAFTLPGDDELRASALHLAREQGTSVSSVPPPLIYPCVAFYGGGRVVSLVSVRTEAPVPDLSSPVWLTSAPLLHQHGSNGSGQQPPVPAAPQPSSAAGQSMSSAAASDLSRWPGAGQQQQVGSIGLGESVAAPLLAPSPTPRGSGSSNSADGAGAGSGAAQATLSASSPSVSQQPTHVSVDGNRYRHSLSFMPDVRVLSALIQRTTTAAFAKVSPAMIDSGVAATSDAAATSDVGNDGGVSNAAGSSAEVAVVPATEASAAPATSTMSAVTAISRFSIGGAFKTLTFGLGLQDGSFASAATMASPSLPAEPPLQHAEAQDPVPASDAHNTDASAGTGASATGSDATDVTSMDPVASADVAVSQPVAAASGVAAPGSHEAAAGVHSPRSAAQSLWGSGAVSVRIYGDGKGRSPGQRRLLFCTTPPKVDPGSGATEYLAHHHAGTVYADAARISSSAGSRPDAFTIDVNGVHEVTVLVISSVTSTCTAPFSQHGDCASGDAAAAHTNTAPSGIVGSINLGRIDDADGALGASIPILGSSRVPIVVLTDPSLGPAPMGQLPTLKSIIPSADASSADATPDAVASDLLLSLLEKDHEPEAAEAAVVGAGADTDRAAAEVGEPGTNSSDSPGAADVTAAPSPAAAALHDSPQSSKDVYRYYVEEVVPFAGVLAIAAQPVPPPLGSPQHMTTPQTPLPVHVYGYPPRPPVALHPSVFAAAPPPPPPAGLPIPGWAPATAAAPAPASTGAGSSTAAALRGVAHAIAAAGLPGVVIHHGSAAPPSIAPPVVPAPAASPAPAAPAAATAGLGPAPSMHAPIGPSVHTIPAAAAAPSATGAPTGAAPSGVSTATGTGSSAAAAGVAPAGVGSSRASRYEAELAMVLELSRREAAAASASAAAPAPDAEAEPASTSAGTGGRSPAASAAATSGVSGTAADEASTAAAPASAPAPAPAVAAPVPAAAAAPLGMSTAEIAALFGIEGDIDEDLARALMLSLDDGAAAAAPAEAGHAAAVEPEAAVAASAAPVPAADSDHADEPETSNVTATTHASEVRQGLGDAAAGAAAGPSASSAGASDLDAELHPYVPLTDASRSGSAESVESPQHAADAAAAGSPTSGGESSTSSSGGSSSGSASGSPGVGADTVGPAPAASQSLDIDGRVHAYDGSEIHHQLLEVPQASPISTVPGDAGAVTVAPGDDTTSAAGAAASTPFPSSAAPVSPRTGITSRAATGLAVDTSGEGGTTQQAETVATRGDDVRVETDLFGIRFVMTMAMPAAGLLAVPEAAAPPAYSPSLLNSSGVGSSEALLRSLYSRIASGSGAGDLASDQSKTLEPSIRPTAKLIEPMGVDTSPSAMHAHVALLATVIHENDGGHLLELALLHLLHMLATLRKSMTLPIPFEAAAGPGLLQLLFNVAVSPSASISRESRGLAARCIHEGISLMLPSFAAKADATLRVLAFITTAINTTGLTASARSKGLLNVFSSLVRSLAFAELDLTRPDVLAPGSPLHRLLSALIDLAKLPVPGDSAFVAVVNRCQRLLIGIQDSVLARAASVLSNGALSARTQGAAMLAALELNSNTSRSKVIEQTVAAVERQEQAAVQLLVSYTTTLLQPSGAQPGPHLTELLTPLLAACGALLGNLRVAGCLAGPLLTFATAISKVPLPAAAITDSPVERNLFEALHTGDRDNYTGQVGIRILVSASLTYPLRVTALGRAVNPKQHFGHLQRAHKLVVWSESDQRIVASTVVDDGCERDALGYAVARFEQPVLLQQGAIYRITSTEYAGCGDHWYDPSVKSSSAASHAATEAHDSTAVQLLSDCWKDAHSWSAASSQSASGVAANGAGDGTSMSSTGSGTSSSGSYLIDGEVLAFPDQCSSRRRGMGMVTLLYEAEQQVVACSDAHEDLHIAAFDTAARAIATLVASTPQSEEEEAAAPWMQIPVCQMAGVRPGDAYSYVLQQLALQCTPPELRYSMMHATLSIAGKTAGPADTAALTMEPLRMIQPGAELSTIDRVSAALAACADPSVDAASSAANGKITEFQASVEGFLLAVSEGFEEAGVAIKTFPAAILQDLQDGSPEIHSAYLRWKNIKVPGKLLSPPEGPAAAASAAGSAAASRRRGQSSIPSADLVGAAAVLEEWMQYHGPEPRLVRRKAKYSALSGAYLASMLRHTGLAAVVMCAMDALVATAAVVVAGEPTDTVPTIPDMPEQVSKLWARTKAFRQCLRAEVQRVKQAAEALVSVAEAATASADAAGESKRRGSSGGGESEIQRMTSQGSGSSAVRRRSRGNTGASDTKTADDIVASPSMRGLSGISGALLGHGVHGAGHGTGRAVPSSSDLTAGAADEAVGGEVAHAPPGRQHQFHSYHHALHDEVQGDDDGDDGEEAYEGHDDDDDEEAAGAAEHQAAFQLEAAAAFAAFAADMDLGALHHHLAGGEDEEDVDGDEHDDGDDAGEDDDDDEHHDDDNHGEEGHEDDDGEDGGEDEEGEEEEEEVDEEDEGEMLDAERMAHILASAGLPAELTELLAAGMAPPVPAPVPIPSATPSTGSGLAAAATPASAPAAGVPSVQAVTVVAQRMALALSRRKKVMRSQRARELAAKAVEPFLLRVHARLFLTMASAPPLPATAPEAPGGRQRSQSQADSAPPSSEFSSHYATVLAPLLRSLQSASGAQAGGTAALDDTSDDEAGVEHSSAPSELQSPSEVAEKVLSAHDAAIHGITLYAKHGHAVPPALLASCYARQLARAQLRLVGLRMQAHMMQVAASNADGDRLDLLSRCLAYFSSALRGVNCSDVEAASSLMLAYVDISKASASASAANAISVSGTSSGEHDSGTEFLLMHPSDTMPSDRAYRYWSRAIVHGDICPPLPVVGCSPTVLATPPVISSGQQHKHRLGVTAGSLLLVDQPADGSGRLKHYGIGCEAAGKLHAAQLQAAFAGIIAQVASRMQSLSERLVITPASVGSSAALTPRYDGRAPTSLVSLTDLLTFDWRPSDVAVTLQPQLLASISRLSAAGFRDFSAKPQATADAVLQLVQPLRGQNAADAVATLFRSLPPSLAASRLLDGTISKAEMVVLLRACMCAVAGKLLPDGDDLARKQAFERMLGQENLDGDVADAAARHSTSSLGRIFARLQRVASTMAALPAASTSDATGASHPAMVLVNVLRMFDTVRSAQQVAVNLSRACTARVCTLAVLRHMQHSLATIGDSAGARLSLEAEDGAAAGTSSGGDGTTAEASDAAAREAEAVEERDAAETAAGLVRAVTVACASKLMSKDVHPSLSDRHGSDLVSARRFVESCATLQSGGDQPDVEASVYDQLLWLLMAAQVPGSVRSSANDSAYGHTSRTGRSSAIRPSPITALFSDAALWTALLKTCLSRSSPRIAQVTCRVLTLLLPRLRCDADMLMAAIGAAGLSTGNTASSAHQHLQPAELLVRHLLYLLSAWMHGPSDHAATGQHGDLTERGHKLDFASDAAHSEPSSKSKSQYPMLASGPGSGLSHRGCAAEIVTLLRTLLLCRMPNGMPSLHQHQQVWGGIVSSVIAEAIVDAANAGSNRSASIRSSDGGSSAAVSTAPSSAASPAQVLSALRGTTSPGLPRPPASAPGSARRGTNGDKQATAMSSDEAIAAMRFGFACMSVIASSSGTECLRVGARVLVRSSPLRGSDSDCDAYESIGTAASQAVVTATIVGYAPGSHTARVVFESSDGPPASSTLASCYDAANAVASGAQGSFAAHAVASMDEAAAASLLSAFVRGNSATGIEGNNSSSAASSALSASILQEAEEIDVSLLDPIDTLPAPNDALQLSPSRVSRSAFGRSASSGSSTVSQSGVLAPLATLLSLKADPGLASAMPWRGSDGGFGMDTGAGSRSSSRSRATTSHTAEADPDEAAVPSIGEMTRLRASLQCAAVGVMDTLVTHAPSCAAVVTSGLFHQLMDMAVAPTPLQSFVCTARLRYKDSSLAGRLLEESSESVPGSSTAAGPSAPAAADMAPKPTELEVDQRGRMVQSPSPTATAPMHPMSDVVTIATTDAPTAAGDAADSSSSSSEAAPEELIDIRELQRREQASTLVAMGFGFDIDACMSALRRCGDNIERTADWLMSGDAQRVLKAEAESRQAAAAAERGSGEALTGPGAGGIGVAAVATGAGAVGAVTKDSARWAAAEELSSIYSMPVQLCFQALLMHSEEPNAAMSWLMDQGSKYVEAMMNDVIAASMARADAQADEETRRQTQLDDIAALENVDDTVTLIPVPRADAAGAAGGSGSAGGAGGPSPGQPGGGGIAGIPGFGGPGAGYGMVDYSSAAGGSAGEGVRVSTASATAAPVQEDLSGSTRYSAAELTAHRAAMGPPELMLSQIHDPRSTAGDAPHGAVNVSALRPGMTIYCTKHNGAVDSVVTAPLSLAMKGRVGQLLPGGIIRIRRSKISGGSGSNAASGRSSTKDEYVTLLMLRMVDAATGVSFIRAVASDAARVASRTYGRVVTSAGHLRSLHAANCLTLTTHIARRVSAAVIHFWSCGAVPSVPMTLEALGGGDKVILLTKLIAASSSAFASVGSTTASSQPGAATGAGGGSSGGAAEALDDDAAYQVTSVIRFSGSSSEALLGRPGAGRAGTAPAAGGKQGPGGAPRMLMAQRQQPGSSFEVRVVSGGSRSMVSMPFLAPSPFGGGAGVTGGSAMPSPSAPGSPPLRARPHSTGLGTSLLRTPLMQSHGGRTPSSFTPIPASAVGSDTGGGGTPIPSLSLDSVVMSAPSQSPHPMQQQPPMTMSSPLRGGMTPVIGAGGRTPGGIAAQVGAVDASPGFADAAGGGAISLLDVMRMAVTRLLVQEVRQKAAATAAALALGIPLSRSTSGAGSDLPLSARRDEENELAVSAVMPASAAQTAPSSAAAAATGISSLPNSPGGSEDEVGDVLHALTRIRTPPNPAAAAAPSPAPAASAGSTTSAVSNEPWACDVCTYLNDSTYSMAATNCEICGADRPRPAAISERAAPAPAPAAAAMVHASAIAPSPLVMPLTTPMINSFSRSSSASVPALGVAPGLPDLLLDADIPEFSLAASSSSAASAPPPPGSAIGIVAPASVSSSSKPVRLARLMLEQCVSNLVSTTTSSSSSLDAFTPGGRNDGGAGVSSAAGGAGAGTSEASHQTVDSLHPYYHRCDYVGEVHCEGAKALRVAFDPRCELARDGSTLSFYSDKSCTQLLAFYPVRIPQGQPGSEGNRLKGHTAFPPLVVHSDKVFYRFRSDKREELSGLGWGYRFHVGAMRGLQWLNDRQVTSEPSLEWACWLLHFLLHDAGRCSRELFEAVHHRAIFDALVRYMRTPGAPYKNRVASLLSELLAHPSAFTGPAHHLPDVSRLLHIANLAVKKAKQEQDAGRLFLPPQMLRLVEMSAAAYVADRAFKARILNETVSSSVQEVVTVPQGVAGFEPKVVAVAVSAKALPSSDDGGATTTEAAPTRVHLSAHVHPPVNPSFQLSDDSAAVQDLLLDVIDIGTVLQSAPALSDVVQLLESESAFNTPLGTSSLVNDAVDGVDQLVAPPAMYLDAALEDVKASGLAAAVASSVGASTAPAVPPPSLATASSGAKSNKQLLWSSSLPFSGLRLRDDTLCRIWLDACVGVAVRESSHPYRAGEHRSGWVSIPGAATLKLCLDRRSVLEKGCSLRFWNDHGEQISFCGVMGWHSPDREHRVPAVPRSELAGLYSVAVAQAAAQAEAAVAALLSSRGIGATVAGTSAAGFGVVTSPTTDQVGAPAGGAADAADMPVTDHAGPGHGPVGADSPVTVARPTATEHSTAAPPPVTASGNGSNAAAGSSSSSSTASAAPGSWVPAVGNMKTWTAGGRDVIEIAGNRIWFEFVAPNHDGSLPVKPTNGTIMPNGAVPIVPGATSVSAAPSTPAGPASSSSSSDVASDAQTASGATSGLQNPGNSLGLWGFAFTVSGATWQHVPGLRGARESELALLRAAAARDKHSTTTATTTATAPGPSSAAAPDSSAEVSTSSSSPVSHVFFPSLVSLDEACIAMGQWPKELDDVIVQWVNAHSSRGVGSEEDGGESTQGAAGTPGNRRMVRSALDMSPADLRLSRKESNFTYEPLSRIPLRLLHLRFALLKLFNKRLSKVLELIDVTAAAGDGASGSSNAAAMLGPLMPLLDGTSSTASASADTISAGAATLSTHLRSLGHLVFSELKHRLLEAAIAATWASASRAVPRPQIQIDNMRAMMSADAGTSDAQTSQCAFAQAYRQLSRLGASGQSLLYRSRIDDRGRLWSVKYVGEEGIDYGGVFRDAITRMVEDVFSDRLDILVPCPNARPEVAGREDLDAVGGDTYLPNTKYISFASSSSSGGTSSGGGSGAGAAPAPGSGPSSGPTILAGAASHVHPRVAGLYFFLGQLMGISLRTRLALPFQFPSLVWKQLVGQPPALTDLRAVDAPTAELLTSLASWTWDEGDMYVTTSAAAADAVAGGSAEAFLPAPSPLQSSISPLLRPRSGSGAGIGERPGPRTPRTPFMMSSSGAGRANAAAAGVVAHSSGAVAAFTRTYPNLRFTTRSVDGRTVELVRGGSNIKVTLANRWQYIAAMTTYHLTAYDPLISHIRRGLYSIVPARALRMLTWQEVMVAAAGKPEIDLRLLKAHTDYEGYRSTDPAISMFWKVLEEFSNEERSLFVRFAWGRSRLPVSKRWPRRFKISRRPAGDEQLPMSHTCFFSIELPPYTTIERMRAALLAAIHFSSGILNA